MKACLHLLFILCTGISFAQSGAIPRVPSNSFAESYKVSRPGLQYSYNEDTQTHNYSGNWDFDNDGKKDELYFVGTGGAHLYFYLRIALSTEKTPRNYEWLLCDMPYLTSVNELKGANNVAPQFIVNDFNNDGTTEIYIHFDASIPTEWRKKGVTEHQLLLAYKNAGISIKNFKNAG